MRASTWIGKPLLREYKDLRSQGFQLRSLDDYGHLKKVISAQRNTGSAFVRQELGGELRGKSNGGDRPGIFHQPGDGRGGFICWMNRRTASLRTTNRRWRGFWRTPPGFTAASWSLPPTLPSCWPSKGPRFMIWMPSPLPPPLAGTAGDADLGRVFPGPSGGVGGGR